MSRALHFSLLAALAAGGLTAARLRAQDDVEVKNLRIRAETFLRGLSAESGPQEAFKELLQGSTLAESEEINRLVAAAAKLTDDYGAYRGADRVADRRVGQDLVLLTYLYKAEKFPVVWRFAFYRPPDAADWTVVSLSFDSKLFALSAEPK